MLPVVSGLYVFICSQLRWRPDSFAQKSDWWQISASTWFVAFIALKECISKFPTSISFLWIIQTLLKGQAVEFYFYQPILSASQPRVCSLPQWRQKSQTCIIKPVWIIPKLPAWLDTTRGALFLYMGWLNRPTLTEWASSLTTLNVPERQESEMLMTSFSCL